MIYAAKINVPTKKISCHSCLLQSLQSTQVKTDYNWLKIVVYIHLAAWEKTTEQSKK
jgi:hypothetical protein